MQDHLLLKGSPDHLDPQWQPFRALAHRSPDYSVEEVEMLPVVRVAPFKFLLRTYKISMQEIWDCNKATFAKGECFMATPTNGTYLVLLGVVSHRHDSRREVEHVVHACYRHCGQQPSWVELIGSWTDESYE